ncbi:DUF4625 domain-containing protein [Algoriphagus sp. AGSA1]|uniref:DUF4625 domain-containing protein n=1 Tax=Algoriphagus sp. AGSA1 TaxID=2907213 RepID=UPI001F19B003|nr:DUF4625 domain-containing protein [Algoriphagus sp. AGSA1]MCE7056098.1 DUF4625 domain-containing protein [Algoriphagus sp. AGSA1]
MKSSFRLVTALFLSLLLLITSSCEDNPDPLLPSPSIDNLEIGSGNNHLAVIGRDFHLNADIVAGDKIDVVQVKIEQLADETYAGDWSFELTWDKFKGIKNTNVHEHFDIPEDALEGRYNFFFIVTDENGTILEEKAEIQLVHPSNLTVDPILYIWMITTDQGDFHFVNETLENPENVDFSKGEILASDVTINNVKGDGKLYLLLIRKDQDHLPESVDAIDFSKVIVYDYFEHENEEDVVSFGNVIYDGEGGYVRPAPEFEIGAVLDNNVPASDLTSGDNGWKSGEYYFGVVYTNSTSNISLQHYFELNVSGF